MISLRKQKVKIISFQEFMKKDQELPTETTKEKNEKTKAKKTSLLPLIMVPTMATLRITSASAATVATPQTIQQEAVPVVSGVIADRTLDLLAHALDPVVELLTALAFPVASCIIVGAMFFLMLGNSEKAWAMCMNAGLGFVLINLMPLFLNILREVGNAV